jgi:hypothetical protein
MLNKSRAAIARASMETQLQGERAQALTEAVIAKWVAGGCKYAMGHHCDSTRSCISVGQLCKAVALLGILNISGHTSKSCRDAHYCATYSAVVFCDPSA